MKKEQYMTGAEIAIIGMAGRFPGAPDIDAFWQNIEAGVESIRNIPLDESTDAGRSPDYVSAGAFLDDIDQFDAGLFGYSPREAQFMDPQHRLFLETAWQALEHAGCASDQYKGPIGVYAGMSGSSYLVDRLVYAAARHRSDIVWELVDGSTPDRLGARLSYSLDLHGPSLTMTTGCSTSLVLVHHACQGLISGDCDVALAGAVRVSVPHEIGYQYCEGGILSRDGYCRSFDTRASGTVPSSGVGVVVLKRLVDAIKDNDTVYAVIKSTAINNDGARKIAFTAPSVEGQADVICQALVAAALSAESIDYVEGHGTATRLGDPVEVKALTQAFQEFTRRRNFCSLGSVKANIGHCDAAAGMAGVIKVAQMLCHEVLPPLAGFSAPNPEMGLDTSPFYLAECAQPWAGDRPRRAGVSSFGVGGTNAHAILEQAPAQEATDRPSRDWQLLCFSGKTASALEANIQRFREWLALAKDESFADAAYTLKAGRRSLDYRYAVIASGRDDAIARLKQPGQFSYSREKARPVIFMFSGQGTQYSGMGRGLFESEPVFRAAINQCAAILKPILGQDIRKVMFEKGATRNSALYRTAMAQPALFTLQFALGEQFASWGIRPRACIGHSIGEYMAAYTAGVFSIEDALRLVTARGAAMDAMPTGTMLAVEMLSEELQQILPDGLSIAALNAPELSVVSGDLVTVAEFQAMLIQKGIVTHPLCTSHAFHSAMMEPCLQQFAKAFEHVELKAPVLPFISSLTGNWIKSSEATRPGYWVDQLRGTVDFSSGITQVLKDEVAVLLELGPGSTLCSLAELHDGIRRDRPAIASMRSANQGGTDQQIMAQALQRLWAQGVAVDWAGYYHGERRRKIALPTYAFQRERYWLDSFDNEPAQDDIRLPVEKWFYRETWRQSPLIRSRRHPTDNCWLIFLDRLGVGACLAAELRRQGATVWTVRKGRHFRDIQGRGFEINPSNMVEYDMLFKHVLPRAEVPLNIVHAWFVAGAHKSDERAHFVNYQSLLYIARACPETERPINLQILSSHLHDVVSSDKVVPARALLVGPCRVIPKEYEYLRCRSIDLEVRSRFLLMKYCNLSGLIAELQSETESDFVALRGRHRYVQSFEQQPLDLVAEPTKQALPAGGTYLITGGFGGIGSSIARFLVRDLNANVILTGRSELPAEAAWDDWLATHSADNAKSRRIALLRELRANGAKVAQISADIDNINAMRRGLAAAEAVAGKVSGVIHTAGIADGGLIRHREVEDSQAVFAPKVRGTLVLDKLLGNRKLDCFVLCSSLAAQVGPFGQVAYCSANAFQNAYAVSRAARTRISGCLSIGWDSWREVGMAVDNIVAGRAAAVGLDDISHGIAPDEGVKSLQSALQSGQAHLFVSTRGWPLSEPVASVDRQVSSPSGAAVLHLRPLLSSDFLAPRGEIEEQIAGIWQQKMGVGPLGVHDDFFELNGHSLMAVQIMHEISRQFQVAPPVGLIYERSTIEKLAEYVAQQLVAQNNGS